MFGYLPDDGVVSPHPPILEEMERTKKALIAAGHEVIDYEPMDHQAAWDLIVSPADTSGLRLSYLVAVEAVLP